MTPEIFRRLAYRCYLSFRFTSYLESNRNPFLIVSQFPTIESASKEPMRIRRDADCEGAFESHLSRPANERSAGGGISQHGSL